MIEKKKGCDQCKDFWQFSHVKIPELIDSNENRQTSLYRCLNCLSYWEESQRYAYILSDEELHKYYSTFFLKNSKRNT